jgi:hypothetical protein
MPIIFQDVTGNSFFRPKISDVSTFTFDFTPAYMIVHSHKNISQNFEQYLLHLLATIYQQINKI